MTSADPLTELEAFVRARMRLAAADKAAFERDGARLNSQLMQGELNMGAAVIGWIERYRHGESAPAADDEPEIPPDA